MNYNTNIINSQKELPKLIDMAFDNDYVINIATKNGNVVLISEEKYNSLIETLNLSINLEYKKTLIDGKNEKIENLIDEQLILD